MENYSKVINETIKKIDWHLVKSIYDAKDYESIQIKNGKEPKRSRTINDIKKELRDLVMFAIESNCKELRHENWIINWSEDFIGEEFRLEVCFVATKSVISEEASSEDDDLLNPEEVEKGVLEEMLEKSISEENYELSAVIHSRLKKIERILKKSKNK